MADNTQLKGLGDVVAKVTSAIGIKPCGGCKHRQDALNKLFPIPRLGGQLLSEEYKLRLQGFNAVGEQVLLGETGWASWGVFEYSEERGTTKPLLLTDDKAKALARFNKEMGVNVTL